MTQFMEWNLKILTFLAEHRSDILSKALALLTYLGSEYLMIAVLALVFLCFDKKLAYKIGFSVFLSSAAVQITKLLCRIERPWTLIDTKYTQFQGRYSPVRDFGAVEGATGYSFPSGHSQSATSLYGTIAVGVRKKPWLKVVLWAIVALVIFSRIYLGVHTPFDVAVGFLGSLLIVLVVNAVFDRIYTEKKYDLIVSLTLIAVSAASITAALIVKKLHPEVDPAMISDCIKMSAGGVGFAIGYFVERRFIDFDPACGTVGDKILRVLAGVGGIFAIKEGVKWLGKLIFHGEQPAVDIIRYVLIMLFAMCLLPFIVKKLHEKKKNGDEKKDRKNVRRSRSKMKKQSKRANYKK